MRNVVRNLAKPRQPRRARTVPDQRITITSRIVLVEDLINRRDLVCTHDYPEIKSLLNFLKR